MASNFEPVSGERIEESAQITPKKEDQMSHVVFDAAIASSIAHDTTSVNEPAGAADKNDSMHTDSDLESDEEEEESKQAVKFEAPFVPKTEEEVKSNI